MPNSRKEASPSLLRIILKSVAALLVGYIIISLLFFTLQSVTDSQDLSDAELINWCQDYYYEREFDELYDILLLYDLYGQQYSLYWEAVDGYNALLDFIQWSKAEKDGIEGSGQKAEAILEQLKNMAASPKHSENSVILGGFLNSAEQYLKGQTD